MDIVWLIHQLSERVNDQRIKKNMEQEIEETPWQLHSPVVNPEQQQQLQICLILVGEFPLSHVVGLGFEVIFH